MKFDSTISKKAWAARGVNNMIGTAYLIVKASTGSQGADDQANFCQLPGKRTLETDKKYIPANNHVGLCVEFESTLLYHRLRFSQLG